MRVRYLTNKLVIRKDNFIIIVHVTNDRLVAMRNGIYYDSVKDSVYNSLGTKEIICELIKLFSFDLEIVDTLLKLHMDKVSLFIKDNVPMWKFIKHDKSYTTARNKELKIYYAKHTINLTSIMFLLSNYFSYFEGSYAVDRKRQCIESICQYHNTEVSLTNALLYIKKEYMYPIAEATNIDLVKYLESYSKYIWR